MWTNSNIGQTIFIKMFNVGQICRCSYGEPPVMQSKTKQTKWWLSVKFLLFAQGVI